MCRPRRICNSGLIALWLTKHRRQSKIWLYIFGGAKPLIPAAYAYLADNFLTLSSHSITQLYMVSQHNVMTNELLSYKDQSSLITVRCHQSYKRVRVVVFSCSDLTLVTLLLVTLYCIPVFDQAGCTHRQTTQHTHPVPVYSVHWCSLCSLVTQ